MLIQCKNIGQQAVFSLDRLGAISTPPGLFRDQIYGIIYRDMQCYTDYIMDKAEVSARMHDADH